MNATGVVILPECAEGYSYALTHTFGISTYLRGYSNSVCSLVGLWKASDSGNEQMRIPRFLYVITKKLNVLALRYQSVF